MSVSLPPAIAACCGSLVLFILFFHLYKADPFPFLKMWMVSWGLNALQYVCILIVAVYGESAVATMFGL